MPENVLFPGTFEAAAFFFVLTLVLLPSLAVVMGTWLEDKFNSRSAS